MPITPAPLRYLNPKVDLAFKRIFEREELLIEFLNAVMPLPANAPIESLTYLSPEQVPEIPGLLKNSIVDVRCRDALGRYFIVEMQLTWSASFAQRMVFSGSQAYVRQLDGGRSYRELSPVYALAILDDIYDRQTPAYYHHYKIANIDNKEQVLAGLEFVFIELPKFKAPYALPNTPTRDTPARDTPARDISRNPSRFGRLLVLWLRFLKEVGQDELDGQLIEQLQANPHTASALALMNISALSRGELEAYHHSLDLLRTANTFVDDAFAEGEAKGEAKGKAEGKAEGIAEGEAKGKAEAVIELIRSMHASGVAPEQIAVIAKLTQEEVMRILKLAPS